MGTFFAEIRGTFVPDHEGAHGPLPPILLAMTFLTGLVDASASSFWATSSSPT